MQKGEKIFTLLGLKKVSVNEIVQAAGIAKGLFYSFIINKEHLYMDIAENRQMKMWREMDDFLNTNRSLPPVELCKQCFIWMFNGIQRYPMLQQADSETAGYLYHRLPRKVIEAHTKDDSYGLIKLQEFGVHFKCGVEIATKALQTPAIGFLNLKQYDNNTQQAIMEMILDGVLKEMIS